MTRNVSAAVTSISSLPQIRYRLLCEINSLTGDTVYACNGGNFIQWNGNTYSPLGTLASVEKIQEDAEVFPRALRMRLAAVSTASLVDLLSEQMFNKPVTLKRTFLTDSFTPVSTPETLFKGFINTAVLKLSGQPEQQSYYEIEVESRLKRMPRAQYFTRETLQFVMGYSGDTFFDYVPNIPLTKTNWGEEIATVNRGNVNGAGQYDYNWDYI